MANPDQAQAVLGESGDRLASILGSQYTLSQTLTGNADRYNTLMHEPGIQSCGGGPLDLVAFAAAGIITAPASVAMSALPTAARTAVEDVAADVAAPTGVRLTASEIIAQAEAKGFATGENQLVLWSGLGKNGASQAQAWVAENGGATLEMTPGGQWLSGLDLFGAGGKAGGITQTEAAQIWSRASQSAASQASGQVRAVLGSVRPTSIFNTIELPTLMENPAVIGIDKLYLAPKIGIQ